MRVMLALTVFLATLALWPFDTPAQGLQERGTLGLEQRRKAQVVRPLPAPATVEEDTEQAIKELQAERRRDEIIRRGLPHIKAPYADPDVRGGIQSQNILRALPRR